MSESLGSGACLRVGSLFSVRVRLCVHVRFCMHLHLHHVLLLLVVGPRNCRRFVLQANRRHDDATDQGLPGRHACTMPDIAFLDMNIDSGTSRSSINTDGAVPLLHPKHASTMSTSHIRVQSCPDSVGQFSVSQTSRYLAATSHAPRHAAHLSSCSRDGCPRISRPNQTRPS